VITPSLEALEAQLEAACAAHVEPRARIDALNQLAWALRLEEPARANVLAERARQEAIEVGYTLGQARAARCMAMTIRDIDGLETVFDVAEEAKRLFDQAGDLAGRAASRDFLASLHEHVGDLARAMPLALEALSLARELGDPTREGYALSNVGGILAASGDHEAAIEHLTLALELFRGIGDEAGSGTIIARLAEAHREAGNVQEALTYARQCLDLGEANEDEFLTCGALRIMAELSRQQGATEDAERLLRAGLAALRSEPGRHIVGAELRIDLARLLLSRGAVDEAEAEVEETLRHIEGRPVLVVAEAAAHDVMAELHERRGDLAAALRQLRRAETLREQTAQRNTRNKVALVEARAAMEAAKKDAEIHRLRYVELHSMQSKLLEADKMALLGKLAAGTAHELNTPLGVLQSSADLAATAARRLAALTEGGPNAAEAARLARVLESCRSTSAQALERMGAIAQSFRRFAELDQAEQRSFDPREGLESALALLKPTLPPGVTLQADLREVPNLTGWPRELNHAFMTVLQNAVQAIDGPGTVSAESALTEAELLIRIRDTGRGMPPEQVRHLFDVGWSQGGGRTRMRLGLSAAYTTTQRHGGRLEVESAVGQGTTVTFRFPRPR
jgi:two-component system NtrC family sensor kinase